MSIRFHKKPPEVPPPVVRKSRIRFIPKAKPVAPDPPVVQVAQQRKSRIRFIPKKAPPPVVEKVLGRYRFRLTEGNRSTEEPKPPESLRKPFKIRFIPKRVKDAFLDECAVELRRLRQQPAGEPEQCRDEYIPDAPMERWARLMKAVVGYYTECWERTRGIPFAPGEPGELHMDVMHLLGLISQFAEERGPVMTAFAVKALFDPSLSKMLKRRTKRQFAEILSCTDPRAGPIYNRHVEPIVVGMYREHGSPVTPVMEKI